MKKMILVLLLFSFSLFGNAPAYYKMGVFLPLSGANGETGQDIKEGIEVFLDFMKDSEGFAKFRMKALIFDTESEPEKTIQIADYLKTRSGEYLIFAGGTEEKEIEKLIRIAEEEKTPYLFSFRLTFQEKMSPYYFPVLPSVYEGFKFLKRFFKEKKIDIRIVYDESTKNQAFRLGEPGELLEWNQPELEKNLTESTILFLSDQNVEKVLERIQGKTLPVFNFHQINLAQASEKKQIWKDALFINWVKTEESAPVVFFKSYFKKATGEEANNYHMLGWMLADLVYEMISKATEAKDAQIDKGDFLKQLESLAGRNGYNEGCGYKIWYDEFSLSKEKSRAGISGVYFMKYNGEGFKIVSDYYSLFK